MWPYQSQTGNAPINLSVKLSGFSGSPRFYSTKAHRRTPQNNSHLWKVEEGRLIRVDPAKINY
jgi:hypothetical protein